MKKGFLIVSILILLPIFAWAASVPINVTWDPNTETDMKEYRIYSQVGVTYALLGTVQHPTVVFQGAKTVADGTMGFFLVVATAVDTSGNESGYSNNVRYDYNFDTTAPVIPRNLRKQ